MSSPDLAPQDPDTPAADAEAGERHHRTIKTFVMRAGRTTVEALWPYLGQTHLSKPTTMLLFGMINWMFTWFRPDGALSYEDMAPIVADLFFGGVPAVHWPAERTPSSLSADSSASTKAST